MQQTFLSPLEAAAAVERAARHHHYEGERMTESFWSKAAASLPPHARRKYSHLFQAAERYEPILEAIVDRCANAGRALGRFLHPRPKFREIGRA